MYSITVQQDSAAVVNAKNADVHQDKRLRVIMLFACFIMKMHAVWVPEHGSVRCYTQILLLSELCPARDTLSCPADGFTIGSFT